MKYKTKKIRFVRQGNHTIIEFEGGGQVPDALSGLYTNEAFARAAITTHLNKSGSKNASSSRS